MTYTEQALANRDADREQRVTEYVEEVREQVLRAMRDWERSWYNVPPFTDEEWAEFMSNRRDASP